MVICKSTDLCTLSERYLNSDISKTSEKPYFYVKEGTKL